MNSEAKVAAKKYVLHTLKFRKEQAAKNRENYNSRPLSVFHSRSGFDALDKTDITDAAMVAVKYGLADDPEIKDLVKELYHQALPEDRVLQETLSIAGFITHDIMETESMRYFGFYDADKKEE
ncbi:MAG: hypothetical protein NT129_04735 [Candidatus Aenigmarchaeota archaeon]|nr:hypothetical protein [Candidatus Aenigmarchaeota archaeon]